MPVISSIQADRMIAKPTIPTLVAIVYGGYEFFMLGFDSKHYLQTYVLVFGGMVSIACVILYVETMRRERRRNFGRMLCALAGFIPYFFPSICLAIWASIACGHS